MTNTNDQITNLDAELDALSSPTTADTYVVAKDYDPDVVAASAARRALGGGGDGGGAAPTSREEWSGSGVDIASGDFEWLTWTSSGGPDAVLDATDPAHPEIITAGVYLVSVTVRCTGPAAAVYEPALYLDRLGFNASQPTALFGTSNGSVNDAVIAFAWYVPAGGRVEVGVTYSSGLGPGNCVINLAHLQRLS